MPEDTRPRRYLIATGVTTGLQKSAERLVESVGRITELFQVNFGYERVTALDLDPTSNAMRQELRAFAKKCHPDDVVALYHTGHADIVASKHRLWMGDTGDPIADTLPTSELAELMLADTPVGNLLVILDTCYAAKGGTEVLLTGIKAAGDFSGKTLLAITSAHPKEQVLAGDFARLFERSVNDPATAGYEPYFLSPSVIVGQINKDPQRKKWQTVSFSTILGTGEPPFLPNPRHNDSFHGLDLATQLQMEQDDQRREDLEKFFNPRARGVDVPQEVGQNFVGRHVALRDLTAWLTNRDDMRTIVVTGNPGSGKSAVIGRLSVLSDRVWGRTVPQRGLPPDTIPPMGSIDVAIHARNRTSEEVLKALCAAARVNSTTPGEFLQAVSGKPMVAAIDSIDEAVDPDRLVRAILNPLIDAGPAVGLRMLLGTRSYLLERLSTVAVRLDLDDQRYADPGSLRVYVENRLRASDASPYKAADPATVRTVAEAVAQAAGRSFLVALITSRTLAARLSIADPADPKWLASLPASAAQAMQQDLEDRLGDGAVRACDLLRPLAFASGNGLPWEDLWAPLASSLAGKDYRDEDLMWLRQNAGSYVVEALEADRSVYRLFHAALAEYLRHGYDERQVHGEFTRFLRDRVPRAAAGEPAWTEAHPYTLSHLATHAAAAGELDQLIVDPGYLAWAAPLGLFAAIPMARDPQARLAAVAYRRAVHRLRSNDLADRLSYLGLAARRARATLLAERIETYPLPRRWSVRWIQWPPDHPHQVLAGHYGPVREVIGVRARDRMTQAASVGDDGTLRLWDLGAAEQVGVHEVSRTALAAIDHIELPGADHLVLVMSTAGILTALEFPSMSPRMALRAYSGLKGVLESPQIMTTQMRRMKFPDGRLVAVTGGPGMMTTIWDIEKGTAIVRLPPGLYLEALEFRKLASGAPVAVSIDRQTRIAQVFDLTTGRHIPNIRSLFRSSDFSYYCNADGTPIVGVHNSHGLLSNVFDIARPTYFDLTVSPGKPWLIRRLDDIGSIRLSDGSHVTVRSGRDPEMFRQLRSGDPADRLIRLLDTGRGPGDGNQAGVTVAKHAGPSADLPFTVTLDGRTITLRSTGDHGHGRERIVLTGHGAEVTDAEAIAAPDQPTVLLSSSIDGTVRVWDVAADIQADVGGTAQGPSAAVVSTLAHEGRTLGLAISVTPTKALALLDLDTGERIRRLGFPSGLVLAATCGWVPEVGPAAITFTHGVAHIWRLSDGALMAIFKTNVDAFGAVADRLPMQAVYIPVPGQALAATCGHSEKAVIWDLGRRRIYGVLGRHNPSTSVLACGMNRKGVPIVATAGRDNKIKVWNAVRGRRVNRVKLVTATTYVRHRDSGHATAISLETLKNERTVIVALCEDGKLRVLRKKRWRPGYQRAELDTHGGASMTTMRFTDGRIVAVTGGHDGRLCAWDLEVILKSISGGESHIPALIEIETEVAIIGLSATSDDTVVISTLSGLAAFRFRVDSLTEVKSEADSRQ
jgi:WD40 repeat protein